MICLCKSALKKKYNINVEDQEYFLQFSCQKHNSAKFCSLIYFFYWYKSFKSTLTFTTVFEITLPLSQVTFTTNKSNFIGR